MTHGDGSSRMLLACFLLAFLISALFLSWELVDHDYEAEYLALGNLVVRGELNLYQDEVTGQWVPLPFWVYGLSQLVMGPSLLAGRLLSIVFGLGVVALIFMLARRWGGTAAAAVACGLFCTNGLIMGYFATVHFSSLVALLLLAGIYVLFCTEWQRRELTAMAVFSVLFLVKPHYWPTIPFVLVFLLWRARSGRERVTLTVAGLAVPVLFFAWDVRHLKMLAYMPIVKDWVAPLGYFSWHTLVEDPERLWVSDYADIFYQTGPVGRVVQIAKSFAFFLKRYLLWLVSLVALGGLAALPALRRRRLPAFGGPTGLRFTFWLFWYLLVWQFVAVGVYIKQAFAYVGAFTPLMAVVLGCFFSAVWEREETRRPLRLAAAALVAFVLVVSPWVHRSHYLPRTLPPGRAPVPALRHAAERLADVIPPGETRIFALANPLPIHLAGRRPYLRQFHQYYMVFTSARDPARYARAGMWGATEVEHWLGVDARYAIIEPKVLRFYGERTPYRELVGRVEALIAERFRLVETVKGYGDDAYRVYARRAATARSHERGKETGT